MGKVADEPTISILSNKKDVEYISSGVTELDDIVSGFARGHITEIWGPEGVGKTWLASKMMATMSKKFKVLYVDVEFALNKERVQNLGADPKNIAYVADARLEQVCELVVREVGNWDVIIIDSLAFLTPMTVDSNEIGETSIGLFSRLIKHWVTKLRPRLAKSKTALVVINQYRKPLGLYVKAEPPGGTSWSHACDVRIKLSSNKADAITEGKKEVGKTIHAQITKNKLGPPSSSTTYRLNYFKEEAI